MIDRRKKMRIKKVLAWVLVLCLLSTALVFPATAAGTDDSALKTVQALGIMQGDSSGNLNLSGNVTRAQFAKMLTSASVYKDTISEDGTGYSLYKDVKSSYWASEYIRVAVQEGWMTGYIDGAFRPEQTIKLEEACAAVLKMLGYDASSLAGSFPYAQLNKASALGLRDQVTTKQGGVLTRRDCVYLFHNLLTAQTNNGQTYATTLGYTVTNGEVDYTAVVRDSLSGPYVADSGTTLPFTPTTIYRDGKTSESAALSQYDVYYYNEGLGTAWIYTERVAGEVTAISPSSTAPTSVTVAGKTYTIGSSTATFLLSELGGGSTGTMATLLLGMNDAVVGVLTGDDVDMLYYGVVQSYTKGVTTEGDASVETTVTVICTDGSTRSFTVDKDSSYTTGNLVSINVSSNGLTVRKISGKSLSGKVNADATKLGDYKFASNVKILDTTEEGDAVTVEPERLAGCTINSSNVRYYTLNEDDEIEHLILEDATGDTWTYGYMTSVDDQSQSMSINVTYEYLIDGQAQTIRSSSTSYPVDVGGIGIHYNSDGSIKTMRQMKSVKLTELGLESSMASNRKYVMADEVQVYLRKGSTYYATTLSAVNAEDYTLTAWYDTATSGAGGQIRVIIAVEK